MILSTLFDSVLDLDLLLVLLLVLPHVMYVLRPPVQPPVSAGIMAHMGIRLTTAKLFALRICLVLEPVSYLYILVLDNSPGLSS